VEDSIQSSAEIECWMSFSVTPVQVFIEGSRTVRDLAVGSLILSGIARAALDAAGGKAVFPADGAGNAIPNTFIREYSSISDAGTAATNAENAAKTYWTNLAKKVKSTLSPKLDSASHSWDNGAWDWQINNYFDFRTLVIDEAAATEAVYTARFPGKPGQTESLRRIWTILGAAQAAYKQVRKFPGNPPDNCPREKCTLLSTLEQMGPGGELHDQGEFWDKVAGFARGGARLTPADRLCAVSLVRRFAPADCASGDPLGRWTGQVDDTATITIRKWREAFTAQPQGKSRWDAWEAAVGEFNAEIKKRDSDQPNDSPERWLLDEDAPVETLLGECSGLSIVEAEALLCVLAKARKVLLSETGEFKFTKPPRYLAVLVMDADRMGAALAEAAGKSRLTLEKLSKLLLDFSDSIAPVVAEAGGLLVYAGGDDLLALLPLESLLPIATGLQSKFKTLLGGERTITAGASVFHYKFDLQTAIREARAAEEDAKVYRDSFGSRVLKRSGGTQHFVCGWDTVSQLSELQNLFENGASDRWASRFEEARAGIGDSAQSAQVAAMLKQFVSRMEGGTPAQRASMCSTVADVWEQHHAFLDVRHSQLRRGSIHSADSIPHSGDIGFADRLAHDFLAMLGAASFIARGRD